ncbi:relaxase/mobilization nuclease domain-containing protein [Variovorax sp. VaC1]|uniref:relaxase/mobilization nuclease domain-containing protein n=1 Tax=Variovorax sp. VaC1 TaxID=3373132 RepID=UPI00374A81C5
MSTKTYVDGMLVDWGASLFNQTPIGGAKGAKKGLTGVPLGPKPKKKGKSGGAMQKADAKAIRSKLGSIAKKAPEVMVKISGGGKGMRHIKSHLDYISRNGKIELENEEGDVLTGIEDLRELRKEWQDGGSRIADESDVREAFNIVLSMPAGTDELAVKRAARDFAAQEFEGHQYVMALHTFATDPDPKPSKNPHVHLAVKAQAADGTRLNPRKADLQRWREGFAEALREHGVEAAATNRQQRLKRDRGEKQPVRQMRERGASLDRVGKGSASPERIAKAKRTEAKVTNRYRQITKALASSPDVEDRKLAVGLVERLAEERRNESIRSTPGRPEKDVER